MLWRTSHLFAAVYLLSTPSSLVNPALEGMERRTTPTDDMQPASSSPSTLHP